jgi:hypothetical protein
MCGFDAWLGSYAVPGDCAVLFPKAMTLNLIGFLHRLIVELCCFIVSLRTDHELGVRCAVPTKAYAGESLVFWYIESLRADFVVGVVI